MDKFVIKRITNTNIINELEKIGFDKSYRNIAQEKFKYMNFKIFSVSSAQANILKQTALSVGADCATHRNVITGEIETSDVILGGSISQLKKITQKLSCQPFSLKQLGEEIDIQLKEQVCSTKLVGILNLTENSFSDGGKYLDSSEAFKHFDELTEQGADVIDIGAESTKPFAKEVSAEVQLSRILPILERRSGTISIDTRSSVVAEECLKKGASIINDVSGLKYDTHMAEIISKYDASVVIQHSLNKQNLGTNGSNYNSVVDDVYTDLYNQIKYAESFGINKIIVDVGIGFDKTTEDNFELLNRIGDFKSLGYPIMLGISRKSFINVEKDEKDIFTLALNTLAINNNVDYIRVHNVSLHRKLLNLIQ